MKVKQLDLKEVRYLKNVDYSVFRVEVSYIGFNPQLDDKLEGLAGRNNGEMTGSGYGGERDLSFAFNTVKDVKTFVRKARNRYSRNYGLTCSVYQANIDINYEEVNL